MVDLSSYELTWPTELFVSEAQRVDRAGGHQWAERVKWLLTDAFHGTTAVSDFEDAQTAEDPAWTDNPWDTRQPARPDPFTGPPGGQWFRELIRRADALRHATQQRPYWPQRQAASLPGPRDEHSVRRQFQRLIAGLADHGYLVEAFGEECIDDHTQPPDPAEVIDQRLGISGLWPLTPHSWDEDTFFGLVEVFHDLVSRPRRRSYHSFNQCGWHYYEFSAHPAQTLYRWRVNQLLASAGIDYRLADEGEDRGRLVAVTDDARSALIHQALQPQAPTARRRIEHAIALYRARGATTEHKRSAIVTLAGVLEERRALLKTELHSKDEGDLFLIANKFNLRHHSANQFSDYDPAFLDWFFWWYLATVELTNRILRRQETASPIADSLQ